MPEHLRIYLDGIFAGDLRQDGSGRVAFNYDEAYAGRPGSTPLSFVIGLRAGSHKPSHVKNWFDGLLPDNAAVREEWSRRYHVSARNPLALLRHVGRDAAGAVQAVPFGEEADDAATRTGSVQWLSDDDLERLLDGLRNGRGDWGREFRNGRWSLAGAQNKVALHRDGERWGIPLDSTPTTHILKASIGGFDRHDINEYACQRAARLLGLTAATTTLLTRGVQRAVVSERYDRRQENGVWRRYHQEDFCQALGIAPELKYQSDNGPGLSRFATLMAQFQGAQQQRLARRTFFDYLCFNVIIGATDAHAKNFSILHVGTASRLAPLYDLASVLPYLTEQIDSAGLRTEGPRSALRIGTTYDLPKISESDIATCARVLGLNSGEGVERYRDLAARAPGAFEEIASMLDDPGHAQFVRDLSAKIAAHVGGRWRNGRLS